MPSDDELPGAIFWATSNDSLGQEERERHPWIVISGPSLARKEKLVIAVPMTSNPFQHYDTEVEVDATQITIRSEVSKRLDPKKLGGWIKCAKVRHWSVERVDEVIGVASRVLVNKIRSVVADTINAAPAMPPPRHRKGRR